MKVTKLALAVGLAFAAGVSQADPVTIDKFNDPFSPAQRVSVQGVALSASSTMTGLIDVLGGSRDLDITCDAGCESTTPSEARLSVALGQLNWANTSGVTSTASVTWDANDVGLNFDLLAAGNSIVATVLEADLGFNYSLVLSTFGGGSTRLDSGTLFAVNAGSPENAFYDVAWFALANGNYFLGGLPFTITNDPVNGGVTLTNVDRIQLVMTNTGGCYQTPGKDCSTAVDLRIDDARVVPEPGTMALAGLGLLGLAAARRRKQA